MKTNKHVLDHSYIPSSSIEIRIITEPLTKLGNQIGVDSVIRVAAELRSHLPKWSDELLQAIRKNDWGNAQQLSHKMAGTSSILLHDHFHQVLKQLKSGNLDHSLDENTCITLETYAQEIMQSLDDFIAQQKDTNQI